MLQLLTASSLKTELQGKAGALFVVLSTCTAFTAGSMFSCFMLLCFYALHCYMLQSRVSQIPTPAHVDHD